MAITNELVLLANNFGLVIVLFSQTNLLIYSKNSIMKKLLMLALVCTLATGTFANNHKPKKQKQSKQCTQQTCTPDCKQNGCCTKTSCVKA